MTTSKVALEKYLEENLIEDYTAQPEEIKKSANKALNMLLERWQSLKSLEQTLKSLEIGVKNFKRLNYTTQKKFLKIKRAVFSRNSNKFAQDKRKHKVYKRLYAIFQKLKENKATKGKYELNYGDIDRSFTILEFPENEEMSEQFKEELRVKEEKKAKIIQFSKSFIKDYLPLVIGSDKTSPLVVLQNDLNERFDEIFSTVADDICTLEPRNLIPLERKLILNALSAVISFFTEMNTAISYLKKKKVNFKKISIEDEQVILISQINSQLKKEKKKIIIPDDFNHTQMLKNIREAIDNTISHYFNDYRSKSLISYFLSIIVLSVIEKLLSPYMMCVIIDRFLIDGILIEGIKEKTIPLKFFNASDKEFSRQLGNNFYQLAKQIIKLGRPSGVFASVASLLTKVLKSKANQLGILAQRSLNQILNSTSVIRPILVLDHILYRKKDGVRIPTLTQTFNKTEADKEIFQRQMPIRIQGKLHPFIFAQIKPHVPKTFRWAAKQMTSLKDFCENISDRLYRFSQQDKLLKMLIVYIIRALKP